VSDPSKLQEEYTRYHFYLQLRKDILNGKLTVSPSTACLLASYIVQCKYILQYLIGYIIKLYLNGGLAELGDYNPDEHKIGYLSSMVLIPDQTEQLETQIYQLHKLHKLVL